MNRLAFLLKVLLDRIYLNCSSEEKVQTVPGFLRHFIYALFLCVSCETGFASGASVGQVEAVPPDLVNALPASPQWDCSDGPTPAPSLRKAAKSIPFDIQTFWQANARPADLDSLCFLYLRGSLTYSDDPEHWNDKTWVSRSTGAPLDAVKLDYNIVAPESTNYYFYYFENDLEKNAHLDISVSVQSGGGTVASYFETHNQPRPGVNTRVGAMQTVRFLNGIFNTSSGPTMIRPIAVPQKLSYYNSPVTTIDVPKNAIVEGEVLLSGNNVPVTIGLSANDCNPACPQGHIHEIDRVKRDEKFRKGTYPLGGYLVLFTGTTNLPDVSGGLSWLDIDRKGTTVGPLLNGYDNLDSGAADNSDEGDYGLPIEIESFNGSPSGLSQRFDLGPRGGDEPLAAMITGTVDDSGNSINGNYLLPQVGELDAKTQASFLGTVSPNQIGSFVIIPSGGAFLPLRIYYALQ